MPGRHIGGSSAGLGEAQRIDSSLRADWLSCFSLAWREWWVARQEHLVPLRKGGMWQSSRPASFSPAGLTLWPNWLERWHTTLSRLSTQVRIPVGLSVPGRYTCNGFELESSSLHQICILVFSQLELKMEVIDLNLQGYLAISTQETTFNVTLVYWTRPPKGCYTSQMCSCIE